MKKLILAAALLAGCNTITAQCELELQVTDNNLAKFRSQQICKAKDYTGTLERTLCRSVTPLDKNNLPAQCKP